MSLGHVRPSQGYRLPKSSDENSLVRHQPPLRRETAMSLTEVARSSATASTLAFGQRVIQGDRTLVLLVEDPANPASWHALDTQSGAIEAITPPASLYAVDRVEPTDLALQVVEVLKSASRRSETAENLVSSCQTRLQEIRDYAIERHEVGDICASGLREFLEHFGMEPFTRTFEFTVSLHGSVSINADNVDAAASRLRYLIDGVAYSGDTSEDDVNFTLGSIEVYEFTE
jgi:hypothetical protein